MSRDYMYYPGCSITSSAQAYDVSTKRVGDLLDMHFEEVPDWNCCGATEYFSVNGLAAYSLVAMNLAKASDANGTHDLVAPCSACYLNLSKTDKYMGQHADLNNKVNTALAAGGLAYEPGTMHVRHLLDVVVEDIGFERIAELVKKPLHSLRVAPYYGCLIARPGTGGNTEYPTQLDDLMNALGATVIDLPVKTHCCGGHMTQISEETAYELIRRILKNATDYEADAIVTLCPMCQLNLDAYQDEVNKMFGTRFNIPVLYFTQLMGVAFGLATEELGFGSEIVAAQPALDAITAEAPKKARGTRKRDKQALPMPSMAGQGGDE